jgi:hypothetical protein
MFAKNTISILSAGALLAISAPAMAEPPHWAPAHGYRAKQNVVVHRHVQPVVKRTVVVHHQRPVVHRTVVHRYHEPHRPGVSPAEHLRHGGRRRHRRGDRQPRRW